MSASATEQTVTVGDNYLILKKTFTIVKTYSGPIAKEDEMDSEARASFEGGYMTVLLPVGTVLWRFVSEDRFNQRFGPFWMDSATMSSIMGYLHTAGDFSSRNKKENIKNSLAILTGWQNPGWRVKITVNYEVIAYVGKTRAQKQFRDIENSAFGGNGKIQKATEFRIGGFEQYVIPRFRGLSNENKLARVEHFVHI